LVIFESFHIVDPVRMCAGLVMERLSCDFRNSRAHEQVSDPMQFRRTPAVSISQQYIVALDNIHFGSQLSPKTGLVSEGWLIRVSSGSLDLALGEEDRLQSLLPGMVMKCLTALLAACFLLAGIGASDAAVRIARDAGGRIETYVGKYQGVRSSGERVIIDGYCASACTIVLGSVPHDRICVTSRARFGFHAAWDPDSSGRKITNLQATQSLYLMYPFELRRWIDQRGGLTPRMIFLSGHELTSMYRPCHLDSQASAH